MNRSGFTKIKWGYQGVYWVCSDPVVFDWVLAELTRILPGCGVRKSVPKQPFVAPFKTTIGKLGGSDGYNVAWWIMKQLCEKGWEPFDVEKPLDARTDGHFFLRLVGRAD